LYIKTHFEVGNSSAGGGAFWDNCLKHPATLYLAWNHCGTKSWPFFFTFCHSYGQHIVTEQQWSRKHISNVYKAYTLKWFS